MLYETQNPHGGDVYGMEVRLDFSSNVNPLGSAAVCDFRDAARLRAGAAVSGPLLQSPYPRNCCARRRAGAQHSVRRGARRS